MASHSNLAALSHACLSSDCVPLYRTRRAELRGAPAAALVDAAHAALARVHGRLPAVFAGARELRLARRVPSRPAQPHQSHRHALLPRHPRAHLVSHCSTPQYCKLIY